MTLSSSPMGGMTGTRVVAEVDPARQSKLTAFFPFRGSRIGGSHAATLELMSALQARSYVYPTLLLHSENEISAEADRRGLEVMFSNGSSKRRRNLPWTDLFGAWSLARWLRRLPAPWLVHTNDLGAHQSWGLAAKLAGGPLVFHNHALNRMLPPNTDLIRLADRTLCVSKACRTAVEFLPPARVATVLNPITVDESIDRAAAAGRLRRELDIPQGTRLIGFVGNFWARKRPGFALDAFAHIHRREPDARLVFFGRDGDVTQNALGAHAKRLGIFDAVRFAGFRLPADENIAAIDVLMMPALSEPFGRTLIEAALLGTPYVASDDAGHSEIGARWGGGVLAALDLDPLAFAQVVLNLLAAPSRVGLTAQAHARTAAEFAPAAHAQAVERIYADILAERPASRAAR